MNLCSENIQGTGQTSEITELIQILLLIYIRRIVMLFFVCVVD